MVILSFLFKKFLIFIRFYLLIWERARARGGAGEREKQTPHWAGSPMRGSIPGSQDQDLSWRQTLSWLSHHHLTDGSIGKETSLFFFFTYLYFLDFLQQKFITHEETQWQLKQKGLSRLQLSTLFLNFDCPHLELFFWALHLTYAISFSLPYLLKMLILPLEKAKPESFIGWSKSCL